MKSYTLPHFGEIDADALESDYDAEIEFAGREIRLDLNFDEDQIETERLDIVARFVSNLAEYDQRNKQYIKQDFDDEDADTVRTYVEHHLEEVDAENLASLINTSDSTKEPAVQLMEKLHLVRVGFYPHNEDQFATFDYSIGEEITQYLVVINIKEDGELDYMTMES